MHATGVAADVVRFRPSKVRGLTDVDEVAVYPDRLELRTAGEWRTYRFEDFAARREPPWFGRLKRRLGVRPYRALVAHLVYVREPYEESYFEFLTEPRLTLYMPAEGPALSPDSHFWRIQEILRRGGYAADDPDHDAERHRRRQQQRPRALRLAGRALILIAAVNWVSFFVTLAWLGGTAARGEIKDGRYYLGNRGSRIEVSRQVWVYSQIHDRVMLASPVLFVAGYLMLNGFPREIRLRGEPGAHRSVSYGRSK